jgi:hypothetical protein
MRCCRISGGNCAVETATQARHDMRRECGNEVCVGLRDGVCREGGNIGKTGPTSLAWAVGGA